MCRDSLSAGTSSDNCSAQISDQGNSLYMPKLTVCAGIYRKIPLIRGSVRSTRGLGPTMTARGQGIGISSGMLPHTLIMSITVQKTSKYYTTECDLEEGF